MIRNWKEQITKEICQVLGPNGIDKDPLTRAEQSIW